MTIKPFVQDPLRCTDPSELPPDNQTYGDLTLEGPKFKTLPSDLHVEGSLFLVRTGITELTSDLFVAGSIGLRNNPITKFPVLVDADSILSDATSVFPDQWKEILTRDTSVSRSSTHTRRSLAFLGSHSPT